MMQIKRREQQLIKRNREKNLLTEFTNRWLRLWARFQVEDLFIALQMLKFSLQWLFASTKHASNLLYNTSLFKYIHASSNSSQKHDKNFSQIMRNGQTTQASPQNPCIKKLPLKLKKSSLCSF
jgi:hypothetical protein